MLKTFPGRAQCILTPVIMSDAQTFHPLHHLSYSIALSACKGSPYLCGQYHYLEESLTILTKQTIFGLFKISPPTICMNLISLYLFDLWMWKLIKYSRESVGVIFGPNGVKWTFSDRKIYIFPYDIIFRWICITWSAVWAFFVNMVIPCAVSLMTLVPLSTYSWILHMVIMMKRTTMDPT